MLSAFEFASNHLLISHCNTMYRPRHTSWAIVVLALCSAMMDPNRFVKAETPDGLAVVTMGAPIGLRSFAPGKWGVVRISVRNGSDKDAVIPGTVYFSNNPDLRFTRRVWVPAKSMRMSWIPMFLPQEAEPGQVWEILGTSEVGGEAGIESTTILAQVFEPNAMAYIGDRRGGEDMETRMTKKDPGYEVAIALRESRGLTRTMALQNERLLPSTAESWEALKHVIICGDRIAEDSAAQAALRQWISQGGRVWIQLNRTSPDTVQALLGAAFQAHIVDRVPLTSFRLDIPGASDDLASFQVDREEPVELVRLMIENADIVYEIDGWPAAFFIPFGHGEVMVTTLDGHGWMRPRGPDDAPFTDPRYYTDFVATDPMRDLAARFVEPLGATTLSADVASQYVADRIGYKVPSRGFVFGILGVFCAGIAAVGLWLNHGQRLEHLAWITVVLGLLATGSLIGSGWLSRQSVGATASGLHVVDVSPFTGEYATSATVAFYQPEQATTSFASTSSTRINPNLSSLDGRIQTIEWVDGGSWNWEGTDFPSGVQILNAQRGDTLASPVRAAATIGPEGLIGQLNAGAFQQGDNYPEDGVIALPFAAPLAANLQPDGSFQAGSKDQLSEGQYISAAFVGDEQRRRQAALASWHKNYRDALSTTPMVVSWVESPEDAMTWGDSVQRVGAKMLVVPLELERTPPDTAVAIPSSLILPRSIRGTVGQSTIFNNKLREWSYPNSQSTTTRLKFQLPDSVLPMQALSARLEIDCNIPSRTLIVSMVTDQGTREVINRKNPTGLIHVDLTASDGLKIDEQGGVIFDFNISDLAVEVEEKTMSNSGWSIRATRLEVQGRTLPIDNEVQQ